MCIYNKGRNFFDIHFTAKNLDLSYKDVLVMLHIDFEVQNDYEPSNPSYLITKRAIYYAARDLAAQLGAEPLENTLFEYLEGVFTTDFDTINKYVDVENNHEVKEALKTMCGLGESLENKGFERGMERGIDRGKFIQLMELVMSEDLTEERASQKAGMTLEEFKVKMQEYRALA